MSSDISGTILQIAKEAANKERVKLALKQTKHVRSALKLWVVEDELSATVGRLLEGIDKQLADIEQLLEASQS